MSDLEFQASSDVSARTGGGGALRERAQWLGSEIMSQTMLVAVAGVFLYLYLMRRRIRLKKEK
jgi:hypothetical protein